MNTGTKAAWIAASANRLRTRFGTWKATVKADIGPNVPEVRGRHHLPDQARDPGRSGGKREQRRGAGQPAGPGPRLPRTAAPPRPRQPRRRRFPRGLSPWGQRHSPTGGPWSRDKVAHGHTRRYHPRSPNGQHRLTKKAERSVAARARRESPLQERREDALQAARDRGAGGDADAVEAEHRALVSRIDKAVQKGALHRRSGARKKSRAARIRAGALLSHPPGAPHPSRAARGAPQAPARRRPGSRSRRGSTIRGQRRRSSPPECSGLVLPTRRTSSFAA